MKLFYSRLLPLLIIVLCSEISAPVAAQHIPQNKVWTRPQILPVPSFTAGVPDHVLSLNGTWKINTEPPEKFWELKNAGSWKDVPVPAQVTMLGFRPQPEKTFAYHKKFRVPASYKGKRIVLRFEGVTGLARAYVNGKFVKEHFGGFNIWTCDITNFVKPGEEAILAIGITEPLEKNASSSFDAGGIIRNVKLMAVPIFSLSRFNVATDLDENYKDATLKVWCNVLAEAADEVSLRFRLLAPSGKNVALPAAEQKFQKEEIFSFPVKNPIKWDAEHPELYVLHIDIMKNGKMEGTYTKKIGFREITMAGKEMRLNGKPVKLRGAGRFDSDPIVGRYLSDEKSLEEVKMLKEANMNFVRPACYAPTEAYLDACDSLGIYVEAENSVTFTKGSQKDTSFSGMYLSQMADLVETVRSRPSVIIYELANETYYGVNIGLTYQYTIAEDPTRPIIYSWSHSVPPGEPWPYHIYSYHYADWDSDLGRAGVAVFNSEPTRPLPDNMPILHDEFAHGSSYYQASLARDPGMRDFWGHSIKKFWERMFVTENCLGGAMWAVIDDNGSGAWAFEWGAIDLWRRFRPEYWHFRKAYSPIRINEMETVEFDPGQPVTVRIKNWYDHTPLYELTVEWSMGQEKGKFTGPAILPHESGVITIPALKARKGDKLALRFTDRYQRIVDEFLLETATSSISFSGPAGKQPSVQHVNGTLNVKGERFEIAFDTTTGMITEGVIAGRTILKGGPYLNLEGGVKLSNWQLRRMSWLPADSNRVVVTIKGSYDSVDVTYDISIDGTGLLTTEYTLDKFKLPAPLPYKIPWNNQSAGGYDEVGITFLLSEAVDRMEWKRKGIWSVYPEDHIGRTAGIAYRYTSHPVQQFGKNPGRPWRDDERDFSVFGQYDIGGRGTNDFRSNKEDIIYASAMAGKNGAQVKVEGVRPMAVRLEALQDSSLFIDDGDAGIKYGGTWTTQIDNKHFIGNMERRSQGDGDFIEFTFNGTAVAWIGTKGPMFGSADVYIDGKLETAGLSLFGRGAAPGPGSVLFSKEGMKDGQHTIRIVGKAAAQRFGRPGQTASSTPRVSIPFDAFQVWRGEQKGKVKLVMNNLWNHTKMGLGNYMKEPVLPGLKFRDYVQFRLIEGL